MNNVRNGMTGMEVEEYEFKLGFLLPSKTTEKLLEISKLAQEDPYEIIIRAIDTLYKAHTNERV